MIIGPRQAGKTTLMQFLGDILEKRNEKHLYLNLDLEEDKAYFASQLKLLAKVSLICSRLARRRLSLTGTIDGKPVKESVRGR